MLQSSLMGAPRAAILKPAPLTRASRANGLAKLRPRFHPAWLETRAGSRYRRRSGRGLATPSVCVPPASSGAAPFPTCGTDPVTHPSGEEMAQFRRATRRSGIGHAPCRSRKAATDAACAVAASARATRQCDIDVPVRRGRAPSRRSAGEPDCSGQSLRSAGTLPPLAASLIITCLCSQTFIFAESLVSPV